MALAPAGIQTSFEVLTDAVRVMHYASRLEKLSNVRGYG